MNIRPTTKQDYDALASIWNVTYPEMLATTDRIRSDDEKRPEKIRVLRYLLELSGTPIGFGVAINRQDIYHPQKFMVTPVVVPEHQGKGYGKALYEHLLQELEPHNPVTLYSWSQEDWPRKMRFLQDRGFTEVMRQFQSRLDVAAFDLTPYEGLESKLEADGIIIKTLDQLESDPQEKTQYQQKIYDLHTTVDEDVPMFEKFVKPDFEDFAKQHFYDDRLVKGGFIVTTHGDKYVGMSELFVSQADPHLHNGLTGVLREYRGKGVALAMKLKGIRFAKAQGAPEIRTENASNNTRMLEINMRLGFKKQPAFIDFIKEL